MERTVNIENLIMYLEDIIDDIEIDDITDALVSVVILKDQLEKKEFIWIDTLGKERKIIYRKLN